MSKSAAWVFKTLFLMAIIGTFALAGLAVAVGAYFSRELPEIVTAADYRPLIGSTIVAGNGKDGAVMAEFAKERRYLVPYEKIPDVVVKAFTSAEDDQFFAHSGINIASMIRAAIANFRAGHVVQGGSTITQQVAKSLVLTSERSFVRKIKEVIVASRIEKNLSKQQILYLYLNQIYLGHGAYGVQAAARTYFKKDVAELTIGEAALLAGLPQAPGKYSPLLNPKKAKERQLYVLRRLYENKFITQSQMSEAAAMPLKIFHYEDQSKKYLVEHIRRYLVDKYGSDMVNEQGLTVVVPTTPQLMQAAQRGLREGLEAVDKRLGYRGPLDKLTSTDAIEKKLREVRLEIVDRRLGYQMLLPDGRMDPIESIKAAGLRAEWQLLEVGQSYPAVVTRLDDKKKVAGVMIGAVAAEMPLEKMKWARPLREEGRKLGPHGDPTLPSKVLEKGEVILAKVSEASDKGVVVELDQEPQVQGAVFSMDVQTGFVLAMEGGYDFRESEFNRAVQAARQPGSAFKPMIYAAALEKGYTPASIIVDAPIVYEDGEFGKWKPANFEEKFYGDTTFRQALIKSRNVPTIKIVQALQVAKLIDYAKRLGMNGQFSPDLSISLGSASISLVEMTKTYALFPRLGRKVTPIFFSKVIDRDGKILEENKPTELKVAVATAPEVTAPAPTPSPSEGAPSGLDAYPLAADPDQVMDPRVAYVMTHLMKEVVNYGTGHEAKNLGRPAAGKTGTTNDYIDAWFMGFTPTVVTGVWVGFDSQRTIGPSETGARAALPIWLSFMKEAVKAYPDNDFSIPPGVVFASIDPVSGKLAAPNSSKSIKEAFIEGTEPKEASENGRVNTDTGAEFFKEDIE